MATVGLVEIIIFAAYLGMYGKTPAAETPDAHGAGHADPHAAPSAH